MSKVSPIAPDVLALTDLVPVDGRVSWVPPGASGFEPYNEFLVLQDDRALLVDTGVALHGPSLVATLREVVGSRALTVFVSRIELDTLGNLAPVLAAWPTAALVTANPIPPIDLVHLAPGQAWLGGPVRHFRLGGDLAAAGFGRLRLLDPVLRTLGTSWVFDTSSGALITSDSFSGEMLATADMPVIRRDDLDGLPEVATLRAHLRAKFDWLARADRTGLARHWDTLFGGITPLALAPLHGRIQAGGALVAEMLRRYRRAIVD